MKIQTGQELLDIIHRNKDAIVVGTGWIGTADGLRVSETVQTLREGI